MQNDTCAEDAHTFPQ
jgi:hypothetical protein